MGRIVKAKRENKKKRPKPQVHTSHEELDHIEPPKPRAISARTANQKAYIKAISTQLLVFGTGCAGTGKTFIATSLAAQALQERKASRLILTRPAVEAGESLGFLPGEIDEKFDPYFRPVRDVLERQLGKSYVQLAIKRGQIEAIPLAFLRGLTFEDCWVILDEAQNTTPAQMKLFLTRIGENCKVVVNGDPSQCDLPGPSGLRDAVTLLEGHPRVSVVNFGLADVVRSGLVADILAAYEGVKPVALQDGSHM